MEIKAIRTYNQEKNCNFTKRLSSQNIFPAGDRGELEFLENNLYYGLNSFIKRILNFFKAKNQTQFPQGDRAQREFLERKA